MGSRGTVSGLENRQNARNVPRNVLGSGLMHPNTRRKYVLKTSSSALRFGVSGLRGKRIENIPDRVENVEGQQHGNAKTVFFAFRSKA